MLVIFCALLSLHSVLCTYSVERDEFIKREDLEMIGASITLTPKEEAVNKVLMKHKVDEYNIGVDDLSKFNPARHFFEARERVEASPVFKLIQKMPKGALLHSHDHNTISQEFFLNLTYHNNVYFCEIGNELYLCFLSNASQNDFCDWRLLSDVRAKNVTNIDEKIKSQFFFNVKNPRQVYPSINVIWKKMTGLFKKYCMFLGYKPVFEEQFYQSLLDLYHDNVKYVEFRKVIEEVYDLDGKVYSPVEVVKIYQEVLARFKKDYPDFIGAQLIFVRRRHMIYKGQHDKDIALIIQLHQLYPNFFAGFDICGQEDLGKPLHHFIDFVNRIPSSIPRFFHAGETNWHGETDMNLIDAILLNTTRIGHGFAITKHPLVMKIVKQKSIAIEVCPISNQVLMLVEDLRNHPAASLIAQGYPIVLGNDNPTFWGVSGLSYDFYMALMGMASKRADLKFMKQLILNSWQYSVLPPLEKAQAIESWRKDWEEFLDSVIYEVKGKQTVE